MKDLDRTQVYDLRGITKEQAKELIEWLRRYDKGWDELGYRYIIEDFSLEYSYPEWVLSGSDPTTHISTLFEPTYEPKAGDVCMFWDYNRNDMIIGKLGGITGVKKIAFESSSRTWFKNFEKITNPEIIKLFKNA